MTAARADVLVFGPIPPPVHGAAVVTDRVRRGLADAGAAVSVCDSNHNAPRATLVLRMLAGLWRLLRALPRRPGVYVGGAGGEALWFQAVVVLLARIGRARTVFHHHAFGYLDAPRLSMRLLTAAGGRRLVHVVLGEEMGSALRRRYRSVGTVVVCSNAGQMAPGELGCSDESGPRLVIGHLSNLTVEKGLAEVVETARRARSAGVDVELRLAGPAADAEAARILDEAQQELGDRLTWAGPVPPEQVDDFYRGLDVFLFPSRYVHEAEPLVVLEAARNGVPVVAYDVGCVRGMVTGPGVVVERDGDLPSAAVELLRKLEVSGGPSLDERAAVRDGFLARRTAALEAYDALLAGLRG